MFDIGWQEIFLIAVVALIIIGPKDLPRALKTVTGALRKVKGMARDFQSGLDDIVRETELADMRREIESQAGGDIRKQIEQSIDPDGEVSRDLDEMRNIEGDLNRATQDFSEDVKKVDPAVNPTSSVETETPVEVEPISDPEPVSVADAGASEEPQPAKKE